MEQTLTKREFNMRYGSNWKTIWMFCLTPVVMMLIQSLYNIFDKLLMQEFGSTNVAAVQQYKDWFTSNGFQGSFDLEQAKQYINISTQYSGNVFSLMNAFCTLVGVGASLIFVMEYGRRNIAKMSHITANTLVTSVIFAIFISFIIFFLTFPGNDFNKYETSNFTAPLFRVQMHGGDKLNFVTLDLSWRYVKLLLYFSPLMFLSYVLITFLRTEGKTVVVCVITIVSLLVNIGLDILFLQVFKMNMEGAMIATILSYVFNIIVVSCIMIFSKNTYLKFKLKDLKLDFKSIRSSFALGIAPFFANAAAAFTSIITTILVNKLPGSAESLKTKGISILQQLYSSMAVWVMFMMAIIIGISQGARTLLAYAYGAKKYNRIWQLLKRVAVLEFVWLIICLALITALADQMIIAFAFPKVEAWKYRWYVVLNFSTIPFATVSYTSLALFQSIKKSFLSLISIALRSFVNVLALAGIGYAVALSTENSSLYFTVIGLTDLVSALMLIPVLWIYWKRYRNKLIDHPDDFAHPNEKLGIELEQKNPLSNQ